MQFTPLLSINHPHWRALTTKHSLPIQTIYHFATGSANLWPDWTVSGLWGIQKYRGWILGILIASMTERAEIATLSTSLSLLQEFYYIPTTTRHYAISQIAQAWARTMNKLQQCYSKLLMKSRQSFCVFWEQKSPFPPTCWALNPRESRVRLELYRHRVEPYNQSGAQDGGFRQPKPWFEKWEAQLHTDILKIFSDVALPTQWWWAGG